MIMIRAPLLLLLSLAAHTLSPEAAQHMQAGITADKQREFDVAIAEFQKVTELDPAFEDGFISLGQAYMEKRDFASAIAPLKHALEVNPDSTPAHQLLGYALLVQGYAAEAVPHLARAQDKTALGIAQIQTGQLTEAVANLQAALAAHPNDPDILYYLGRASGLWSKQSIDTLLAAYPDSPRAHQAMGENYFVLRQMPEAEKEYRDALRLRPDLPEVHLELGEVYAGAFQWAKAEEEFRAQAKLQPGNAEGVYRLGAALLEQGKVHEARAELLRANKLVRWRRRRISGWRASIGNRGKRQAHSMKCRSSRDCRVALIRRKHLARKSLRTSEPTPQAFLLRAFLKATGKT